MIFLLGCSTKNYNSTKNSQHQINIVKSGDFLFYAFLKKGEEVTRISKKILAPQKDEEIIRVYQKGYYPVYDIFTKGKTCSSRDEEKSKDFCNSLYTEVDSPTRDTVMNTLGSVIGLTLVNGFQYHKKFSTDKFKYSILTSKLPFIVKKLRNNDFNVLNISKLKINIKNSQKDIVITSAINSDIIMIYDKDNNFKSVVNIYNLKNKEFFEATKILSHRLIQAYISSKYETETTAEYNNRIKQVLVDKNYFIKMAMEYLIGKIKLQDLHYNADEQLLYAKLKANHKYEKDISLNISRDDYLSLKNRGNYNPILKFQYQNKDIKLKELKIDNRLVNFNPINKPMKIQTPPPLPLFEDDDLKNLIKKIAQASKDSTKWVFVIGAEKYDNTDEVTYSKRSAEIFIKVAQKSLGVIDRNSYALIGDGATSGAIEDKLKLMLRNIKNGDSIYFFYSGHGIPVLPDREPYMLPKDKVPDFIKDSPFFKLDNIYNLLSNSKASKIIAVMDSCFSGSTDGVSIIKGVAGSVLVPKKITFNHDKMVVLTAGRDKQFSNMYPKKGHRLFSYFIMKSLLEGKRSVKDVYNDVFPKVKSTSNGFGDLKRQEPTIEGNEGLRF